MPMLDISARRTSKKVKHHMIAIHCHNSIFSFLISTKQKWRITSVSKRLFPQKVAKLLGPGFLNVFTRALQRIRIAWFSLAEPNLEFCGRIRDNGSQANVRRFNAMFIDVNIKVLKEIYTYISNI